MDKCQTPFVVLGRIARQMVDNKPLSARRIVFGILKQHANALKSLNIIQIVEPTIEVRTDGWRILYHDIPIYLRIIPKRYPTLINPDTIFYMFDTFKIPNPFETYWKGDHYVD